MEDALLDPANLPNRAVVKTVADAHEGRVFETTITDVKVRTGNGMVAATNHFIDPSWGLAPPASGAASGWTHERLANLIRLAESGKGSIDAAPMRSIFDLPLSWGGATGTPATINQFSTIYQVVAVPAELIMWFKTPGYSDWQLVNLNTLFQR